MELLVNKLKKKNIYGFLIQVLDPLEIDFNINQNLTLQDMENNQKINVDDSILYKKIYDKNFKILNEKHNNFTQDNNWNYMIYNTDDNIKSFIIKVIKKINLI